MGSASLPHAKRVVHVASVANWEIKGPHADRCRVCDDAAPRDEHG